MRLYRLDYLCFMMTYIIGVLFDKNFNDSITKWTQCALIAVVVIIQLFGLIE